LASALFSHQVGRLKHGFAKSKELNLQSKQKWANPLKLFIPKDKFKNGT
jgi:hypothetical protein